MEADTPPYKSFDFAADTVKQLIALSTAIIAFTVTFSKDLLGNSEITSKNLLAIIWLVYILSIISGILTLMALTATLEPKKPKENATPPVKESITVYDKSVRICAGIQIIFFGIAIILTGVFGYVTLSAPINGNNHKNSYPIRRIVKFGNDTTKYIDTIYIQKNK